MTSGVWQPVELPLPLQSLSFCEQFWVSCRKTSQKRLVGLSTSCLHGWTAGYLVLLLAFPSLFPTPRPAFLLPGIARANKLYARQLLSQAVPPG